MNASHPPQTHHCGENRKPLEQLGSFPSIASRQQTSFPTPPIDGVRANHPSDCSQNPTETRRTGYRLPRPLSVPMEERQPSVCGVFARYSPMPELQNAPRLESLSQHVLMVPTYLQMYHHSAAQSEHWQTFNQFQGPLWPHENSYPMLGCGLVQRPLPPAPLGPVEKPKRRRAPPAPQYIHMTVQEMIEELAYRKIDTQLMQARKAKKVEYTEQLQRADREGNLGRGAWKSCHGDVPPIEKDTLQS